MNHHFKRNDTLKIHSLSDRVQKVQTKTRARISNPVFRWPMIKTKIGLYSCISVSLFDWLGALVQWVKLPAWKVGDLQVSKKQNVSSSLTRKDSISWGTAVTER